MAKTIDLVNVGIFLFIGLTLLSVFFVTYLLAVGAVPIVNLTVALITISLIELTATIGLWLYSARLAQRSRPALAMLGEIARRSEMLLNLSTPIFDLIEEASSRFQWNREARAEFLREKVAEYEDRLEEMEAEEPKPPTKPGVLTTFLRGIRDTLSGWGKEETAPSNPGGTIRINRRRGRRLE